MFNIIERIIDSVYPRRCIVCNDYLIINSDNKWFCKNCSSIPLAEENYILCKKCGSIIEHFGNCARCNENKVYYDKGYALYEYEGSLRDILIKYKFNGKKYYADFLIQEMTAYARNRNILNYDYITCVPLHRVKKNLRGYNQSELPAKGLAMNLEIEYKELLVKIKNTKQQSSLSAKDRELNIKNAFVCNENLNGKCILIIDDVITTGSTINECCKVLKNAGASKVDFIVIACTKQD
jgi:phosphoribosyl transferase domain protein